MVTGQELLTSDVAVRQRYVKEFQKQWHESLPLPTPQMAADLILKMYRMATVEPDHETVLFGTKQPKQLREAYEVARLHRERYLTMLANHVMVLVSENNVQANAA